MVCQKIGFLLLDLVREKKKKKVGMWDNVYLIKSESWDCGCPFHGLGGSWNKHNLVNSN